MSPQDNPLREGLSTSSTASSGLEPCALVIFGASGDLTRRKLVPAVYNLGLSRLLPQNFACVGVARRPKADFAAEMRDAVSSFSRRKPVDPTTWDELAKGVRYVQGDFDDPATFAKLRETLEALDVDRGTRGNRVYYLAVGPDQVPAIVRGLDAAGLIAHGPKGSQPYTNVVIEKPFGEDLRSARQLNQDLAASLAEHQMFRIDHYLGKETVQNLLVFRFGNTIFEPLWSRAHVSHVEITVAEELGMEGRGKFYDKTGITRDIVQNHVLQLLTLVGMEPPSSWDADAVRDEKVKVLRSLRPITGATVLERTVRGQYSAGTVKGERVQGFREEPDVEKDSSTETFVAMRLALETWRWGGVPFYMRAGKRLARRLTEIVLHFKELPHGLFRSSPGASDEPNSLVLRIQPDEGISLRFTTKIPGGGVALRDVAMDFRYGAAFGSSTPEAYERLLLDAMQGNATLFTRADEVEAQWGFIDPILVGWTEQGAPVAEYEAGSWGPASADRLFSAPSGLAARKLGWRKP